MSRDPNVAQLLADRVKELRERQELSPAELARRAELTRGQILVLERGERVPTVVTVAAVARALHVPIAELFSTGSTANPGPDPADLLTRRVRALGPEAIRALEAVADAIEAAKGTGRRRA